MPRKDPSHTNQPDSDDGNGDDEAELKKKRKKNADAQASFRTRRTNYIATLETAVTQLENVVVVLQASCREAKSNVGRLREEVSRLRREACEREQHWQELWHVRQTGFLPDPSNGSFPPSYARAPLTIGESSGVPLSSTGAFADNPQDSRCSPTLAYPPVTDSVQNDAVRQPEAFPQTPHPRYEHDGNSQWQSQLPSSHATSQSLSSVCDYEAISHLENQASISHTASDTIEIMKNQIFGSKRHRRPRARQNTLCATAPAEVAAVASSPECGLDEPAAKRRHYNDA